MITAATRALIKLFKIIEPNTILSAGSITEISELPAIVLSGPIAGEKRRMRREFEEITAYDRENNTATVERAPRWYDLSFNAAFSCKSTLELVKLMEECSRLNQREPVIEAIDEQDSSRKRIYSWAWRNLPSVYNAPNLSEVCEGRGDLIIYDVEVYNGLYREVPLIQEFSASTEILEAN